MGTLHSQSYSFILGQRGAAKYKHLLQITSVLLSPDSLGLESGNHSSKVGLLGAVRLPRRGSCACRRVSAAACSGCSGGPARRPSSCLALLLHRRGSHHPPAALHSHPAHPVAAVGWNDSSLSVPPAGLGARCAWDGGVSWGKLGGPRHTRGVATLLGTPFFLSPSNCHRVRHLINTP